jgi:putative transposase
LGERFAARPQGAPWGRATRSTGDFSNGTSGDNYSGINTGAKTTDVCRKYGISSATFYKWKAKYGGLDVSDAKRLKALEDENSKLKKLLADAMLDIAMLKEIASKKW